MAKFIKWFFLIVALIFYMLPVYYSIASSFKSLKEVYSYPPSIFPKSLTLDGYREAIKNQELLTYLKNTIFVATTATVKILFLLQLPQQL